MATRGYPDYLGALPFPWREAKRGSHSRAAVHIQVLAPVRRGSFVREQGATLCSPRSWRLRLPLRPVCSEVACAGCIDRALRIMREAPALPAARVTEDGAS